MITTQKDKQTNKVNFFKAGKQVYPLTVKGNIATFKNGISIIF